MTEHMKRGGKKRKSRRSTMSQSVKVNVHVGDTVRLRPDSQLPRSNPGEFRRLAGPGNMFADIPHPLASGSYGVAPSSAVPLTHPYFVAGGNRQQQDKRDDILQVVNPAGIQSDLTPSSRLIPSSNKNAMPLVNQPVLSKLPFQGDIARLAMASSALRRAVENSPSAGGIMANRISAPSEPPSIMQIDTPVIAGLLSNVYTTSSSSRTPDESDQKYESVGARVAGAGPGRRTEKEMLTYGPSGVQQTIPLSQRKMARGGMLTAF
jgi:hypothetical protein